MKFPKSDHDDHVDALSYAFYVLSLQRKRSKWKVFVSWLKRKDCSWWLFLIALTALLIMPALMLVWWIVNDTINMVTK